MLVYPSPCRDDLAAAWRAAVDDAGLSMSEVALFWRDGRPRPSGQEAASWRAGSEVEAEFDDGTAFEEALIWLNSDQIRDLRRVMVWTGRTPEGLAGLLRHELEHTLQIAARVELEHLHHRAYEEVEQRGGTGKSYNAIPMEADANRASARFLRRRFGADRLRELVEAGGGRHMSTPPQGVSNTTRIPTHQLRVTRGTSLATGGGAAFGPGVQLTQWSGRE